MKKPVFGLTGGIACGKSTVARAFKEMYGIPVVDADAVARDVVRPGTVGLTRVVEAFGAEILTADGALDRVALGAKVFADASKRAQLEGILHPLIHEEGTKRLEDFAASAAPYVLYEAALLVETQSHARFDGLVVVAAEPETQIARVMARDGLDADAARARLTAQLPLAAKIALADVVIHNEGDEAALAFEVARAHATLLARVGGESG